MFSMPRDIPASFDDEEAGWILRECWQSTNPRLTKSQMMKVRSMLSYSYQLKTGRHHSNNAYDPCNWASVREQWGCQNPDKYAPDKCTWKAEIIPEPDCLRKAFTTEWTPDCRMPYMRWCPANLLTFDWAVNGNRSGEGLRRVKVSKEHEFSPSQGWMRTRFVGGRPKLPGMRGRREWWNYRVCLCPGGKHKPIPDDWMLNLDSQHNPREVTWCTVCPLNCFKTIRDSLPDDDFRTYVRWLPNQNQYSNQDNGIGGKKLIPECRLWLNCQGANPDGLVFDSNSGRKSLAAWCSEFSVQYHQSFQIHGDLPTTWKYYYQSDMGSQLQFRERDQSREVDVATKALWLFARGIGRGRTTRDDPIEFNTQMIGQMLALNIRAMGHGQALNQILDRHDHQ